MKGRGGGNYERKRSDLYYTIIYCTLHSIYFIVYHTTQYILIVHSIYTVYYKYILCSIYKYCVVFINTKQYIYTVYTTQYVLHKLYTTSEKRITLNE